MLHRMLPMLMVSFCVFVAASCGEQEEDPWECCYGTKFYSCPNKSAQITCEQGNSEPIYCDRKPREDHFCK